MKDLQSQLEIFKSAIEAGKFFVYGYLRRKDSGTAKAGTLYYVGISTADPYRPYKAHTRGGKKRGLHDVPVPQDRALVRCLSIFDTKEEAKQHEIKLIARLGRKGIDAGGILLNRDPGGSTGYRGPRTKGQLAEMKAKRVATAKRLGIDVDRYLALPNKLQRLLQSRHDQGGMRGDELFKELGTDYNIVEVKTAEKFGIPVNEWISFDHKERTRIHARWRRGLRGADLVAKRVNGGKRFGIESIKWNALSDKQQDAIRSRFEAGLRGEELFSGRLSTPTTQAIETANRLGIDPQEWMNLDRQQRQRAQARFALGVRGAEMLISKFSPKTISAATKYQVAVDIYAALTDRQRRCLKARFHRGQRGDDLLKGLSAA